MNLLQHLNELQKKHGWLPDEVLREFATDTRTPLYEIQAVATGDRDPSDAMLDILMIENDVTIIQ